MSTVPVAFISVELMAGLSQLIPGNNALECCLSCPSTPFLVEELGYNEQALLSWVCDSGVCAGDGSTGQRLTC
jgi:hypothetical protein